MSSFEAVDLSEPHPPKQASIEAFSSIEKELKRELIKLREDHDSKSFPP